MIGLEGLPLATVLVASGLMGLRYWHSASLAVAEIGSFASSRTVSQGAVTGAVIASSVAAICLGYSLAAAIFSLA